MTHQFSSASLSRVAPSIYLDYGADEHNCEDQGFEICERGMRFSSRWQFALGTQLAVAFSFQDSDGTTQRVATEGIVVDCEKVACKCHLTTLLFLELPSLLRTALHAKQNNIEANVAHESKVIPPIRQKPGLN
jgi:outer membrane receptor for Fe3+-dicitrate